MFASCRIPSGTLEATYASLQQTELLAGVINDPECRSYCCHFHVRSCLTSCFTLYSFFTTLVATRRRRCLLRSVWVNVMPERLLSVISGILAGGIPGFRIELCCFYHPLAWPLCVVLCFLCFASFFGGHTHTDTQDVIVHVILIAGSDPSSLCFLFVLVWLWFCVFCLLGCFCFWFVVFFLDGTAHWTVYRSTTSAFVAIDK